MISSRQRRPAARRTGLRPMTPDGTPVVGATRYDNLFLNTGHGTLGWTMACGSGKLVADQVMGQRPAIRRRPGPVATIAAPRAASRWCWAARAPEPD